MNFKAARDGDIEKLDKCLVDGTVDVDETDSSGYTALLWASYSGHLKTVKYLVAAGANINHKNKYGDTALHCASFSGHADDVQAYTDVVNFLLNGTQYKINVNEGNNSKETPLHLACFSGHIAVVKLLVDHGADIHTCDNCGWTALLWASVHRAPETVDYLIKRGANLNDKDKNGEGPLHTSCGTGNLLIVKFLLRKQAISHLDDIDDNGNTPLHAACMEDYPDVVKLLLQKGANISIRNARGLTPLEAAVEYRCHAVVRTFNSFQTHLSKIFTTLRSSQPGLWMEPI